MSRAAFEANDPIRAAFWEWVDDQGCDTDGAWSAWQGAWEVRQSEVQQLRELLTAAVSDIDSLRDYVGESNAIQMIGARQCYEDAGKTMDKVFAALEATKEQQ